MIKHDCEEKRLYELKWVVEEPETITIFRDVDYDVGIYVWYIQVTSTFNHFEMQINCCPFCGKKLGEKE